MMKKDKAMKRALLINPPTGVYIREDRCQWPVDGLSATSIRPPIDLAYAAAVLRRQGVACTIKDYPVEGGGWEALEDDLRTLSPDLLLISVTSPTHPGLLIPVAVIQGHEGPRRS